MSKKGRDWLLFNSKLNSVILAVYLKNEYIKIKSPICNSKLYHLFRVVLFLPENVAVVNLTPEDTGILQVPGIVSY